MSQKNTLETTLDVTKGEPQKQAQNKAKIYNVQN